MKIESFLPVFKGFYQSLFEYNDEDRDIEHAIEQGDAPEGSTYDDFEWNYADHRERVAKALCNAVAKELDFDLEIKYQNIYSPRFYNFENDSINVEYTLSDDTFKSIVNYLKENKEEFAKYLEDNFTTCDGFISFYSNEVDIWFNIYLNDMETLNKLFGSVLDFISLNEEITEEDLYYEVHDENWIEFTYNEKVG